MSGARRIAVGFYAPIGLGALAWIAIQGRGLELVHPMPWVPLPYPRALALSTAAGLALAVITVASSRLLVRHTTWATRLQDELRAMLGDLGPEDVAVLAVTSGVAEELFFRGAMLPAWGLGWSSLLFAAAHPPMRLGLLPWTVWAGTMGVLLGALYACFGSLAGPILAHGAINFWNLRFVLRHSASSARTYRG